ncbi:MAG: SUMF1/EgtB/PvdO family nonheme iron enzyme [Labilithrix sp.]|nr:SUMF1/EgtB/PvdO family nonheme iron enzyme [Labilithrix sp.]MCW5812931.1 SUMF1/EgtB/PvdO family nonheme iron enzyme [Labilithrix sp.]
MRAPLVRTRLVVFALVCALPIPFALADDGGAPAAPASAPSTPPASSGGPGPATVPMPSSSVPHVVEGEEADEHPAPKQPPQQVVLVRQSVVVKDGMARIPGGKFTMGTDDKKAPPNERPSRVVVVPPFWLDKTEVTVGAYRACVDKGACPRPVRSSLECTWDKGEPQLPISCVSWTNASTYCASVGKRLPREVEWEMAARGTTPIRYPWGGQSAAGCGAAVTLASEATQRSCGGRRPSKVGTHMAGASPFGIHDMSGNVEEWVADWYAETSSDLSPRAGASHVLRGGGWLSTPSASRTTSRNWGSAREAGPNVGFRCAKDATD